jgi:serine/threonine protein kinase
MDSDRSRLENYSIIKTLGKGATSVVKLAKEIQTGDLVAIKIIRPDKLPNLRTELEVLQRVTEHPNIIKLLNYSDSSIYYKKSGVSKIVSFITLELGKNGEIFDYVSKLGAFPEQIARKCFTELISGIDALHKAGVVHRDLKPENIFFDESFQLKLADFGFCAPSEGRDGDGLLKSFKGTRPYMAPEILEHKPYCGVLTDIFSAGIILFILMVGHPPFVRAEKINPHYANIVNNNWERFWRIHNVPGTPELSVSFKDLIAKMLVYSPDDRITISQIKEHSWFKDSLATQDEIEKFLSSALTETEVQTHETGNFVKGYRSLDIDDELPLSRSSSRGPVYWENTIYRSTRFTIKTDPEALFEGITQFFREKGTVKINSYEYEIKLTTNEIIAHIRIIRKNDRYMLEMNRIAGDHWKFYEIYQDLYESVI